MFVAGNILQALAIVVDWMLSLYMWVIIANVVMHWVQAPRSNPIVDFLERVTEPVLYPIRRRLGWRMGIDLSPLIVIGIIIFLQISVVQSLRELAFKMH